MKRGERKQGNEVEKKKRRKKTGGEEGERKQKQKRGKMETEIEGGGRNEKKRV